MSAGEIGAGGAEFELSLKDDLTRDMKAAMAGVIADIQAVKQSIDREMHAISDQISETGKTIAKVGASVAVFGAASSYAFLRAVDAAGDFTETVNMFDAVFKGQSESVRAWGAEYAKVVGRSEAQLLDFLAQSQDTFVPLGFDRQEAAELSKTVAKLAIDLGSFKNMDDADALNSLLGALVGNTENLKRFGVVANIAAIKAKALTMGFDPDNLTSYQKTLAILEITLAGTADAQGDAVNTAGEYSNSVKALGAEMERFKIAIGSAIKDAVTEVIRGITAIIGGISSLLERFPILAKVAAVAAVALTAIGTIGTIVGLAIATMGGVFTVLAAAAIPGLIAIHGWLGAIKFAAGTAGLALKSIRGAVAVNSAAFAASGAAGVTAGTRVTAAFKAIGSTIQAVLAAVAAMKWKVVFEGLKGSAQMAFRGLVSGFRSAMFALPGIAKSAVGMIGSVFAGMFKGIASGFGVMLKGIAGSVAASVGLIAGAVVVAAAGIDIAISKQKERHAKEKGDVLEQMRREAMGRTNRDLGIEGADVTKTLDIDAANERAHANAAIKAQADASKATADAQAAAAKAAEQLKSDNDLSSEIQGIKSDLQEFREKIQQAARLRDEGKITQGQFDQFANQEAERARKSNPDNQKRDSLLDSLMTPIEVFRATIASAERLIGRDAAMMQRVRDSALEQFKASDAATQMALQLRTPLEQFQASIKEAHEVFANDPENLKRAIDAAEDLYESNNPIKQFQDSLRTPIEIFRDRMEEIKEIVSQAAPELQGDLLKRGEAQARKDFEGADTDTQTAKGIREMLKSDVQKLGENLGEAYKLKSKGMLSDDELSKYRDKLKEDILGESREVQTLGENLGEAYKLMENGILSGDELAKYRDKLKEDALGDAPDVELSKSIQSTSAMVASQLGAFGPSFDPNKEALAYQKEQVAVQKEMLSQLKKSNERRGLLR